MSSLPFDLNTATKFFFDRPAVTTAVDQGAKRSLSKFGAFVRQRAKTSIRKAPMADAETGDVVRGRRKKGARVRPAVSRPGSPPYSHEGSLRRLILFAYDPAARSVVVGPVPFKNVEAPRLLEYGGTVTRRGKDGQTRTLHYRPRPFMNPAFQAELSSAAFHFAGMIR